MSSHGLPALLQRVPPMTKTIFLVQLPFPSLSYFPEPDYFPRLGEWYSTVVSEDCQVPHNGLWEIPLWLTWVAAGMRAALEKTTPEVRVEIVDLSCVPFDRPSVFDRLPCHGPGDVVCL